MENPSETRSWNRFVSAEGHLPVLTIPGKRLMLSMFVIADIVNRVENFLTFLTTWYHLIGQGITLPSVMWGTQ